MTTNLKIIRLLNGEEIIADIVREDDSGIEIKEPVRIVVVPNRTDPANPSIGLAPWIEFSPDKVFIINKNVVVATMNPVKEFISEYNRIHSGLVTPTSSLILPT